jgi:NAD(P)-dependent dehydrogenase (short-subunit alcohol dehydrogenase family)
MSPPIAFIIGAGPRVGMTAARLLASQGYKVAVGSRKPDVEATAKEGLFPVTIDISKHETISEAFDEVERGLGGPANVVIFNGSYLSLCASTSSSQDLQLRHTFRLLPGTIRFRSPSTTLRALRTAASPSLEQRSARSRAFGRPRKARVFSSTLETCCRGCRR